MPDPTLPATCLRQFSHGPHETQAGPCEGVTGQQRPRTSRLAERAAEARAELHPPASTECPHAGCVHDAATPDAAHHMDPDLVASLQALGAHYGPRGLQLALEALWPELASAEVPVMAWRGGACRVRDDDGAGLVWVLHADGWWRSDSPAVMTAWGSLDQLAEQRGPLTVVTSRG